MRIALLLLKKKNHPLNCVWKFGSKVKRKLPTQFPERQDLTNASVYVEFAINPHRTLLIQAWEARDTFQRNRPNLIPEIESTI